MRGLLAGLLLVSAIGVAQPDDPAALYDDAVAAIEWDLEDGWAFTELRLSDDRRWAARFDPRLPEAERWTLLTVDGRSPTDDERREFARDKDGYESADNRQRLRLVNAETLQLIEDSDTHWRFRFEPQEDEVEFVDNIDATLSIVKDGRYVDVIDLRNHSDIKPGFGTRIATFVMRMEFGPALADGPVVPKLMQIRVGGRALLFIGFDETEIIEYRDFEPVATGNKP